MEPLSDKEKNWNILLIEDDEDDYVLVRAWLWEIKEKNYQLTWVQKYKDALDAIEEKRFDVILLDYDLGEFNGLDLVRELMQRECDIPILVLTGRGSYSIDLQAMWAGVADYLMKGDVTPKLLERAIRYAIQRSETQKALAVANQQLVLANAVLEARVNERTAELMAANEDLYQINQRLETANSWLSFQAYLLKNVNDAIVAVDRKGNLTAWNPAAEALFDWQADEVLGKNIQDVLNVEWAEHLSWKEVGARLMKDGVYLGEASFQAKSGRQVFMEVRATTITDEEGEVIGMVAVNRDISRRRQMQQEIEEVQRRLMERIERERVELAQEIHDGPMQELYGLTYQVESLRKKVEGEMQESLTGMVEALKRVIDNLRSTAGELRPPALAPYGLEKAIRSHVEPLQIASQVVFNLDLDEDGHLLPERIRLALFRIYQVAVINVVRHSHARHATIRLKLGEQSVLFEVEDDGVGFEMPERWLELARENHLGLIGAGERAAAIGGHLEVISTPGKGTCIRVQAPRSVE